MKLTKSKLKQIIKEELQKTMLDEISTTSVDVDAPPDDDTEMSCKMKGGTWDSSKKPGMRCTYSDEFNEELKNLDKNAPLNETQPKPEEIVQIKKLITNIWLKRGEFSAQRGEVTTDKVDKVVEIYKNLSEKAKSILIKNFKMYAEKFKDRQEFHEYLKILQAEEKK